MTNQSQNTASRAFSSLEILTWIKFQTSRFLENLDSGFFLQQHVPEDSLVKRKSN